MPGDSGASPPTAAAPFPRALLTALRAAAPEGAVLRLGLWSGEVVSLGRVVREDDDGLLGELDQEGRAGQGGRVLAAVPWHAVARVEAVSPKRRAQPGFAPPAAAE